MTKLEQKERECAQLWATEKHLFNRMNRRYKHIDELIRKLAKVHRELDRLYEANARDCRIWSKFLDRGNECTEQIVALLEASA